MTSLNKPLGQKKVGILSKEVSENDVYAASVKQPNLMIFSEHDMSSIVDIIINGSNFVLSDVVQRPKC